MSRHKYLFKLFIIGFSPQSQKAIENVRSICENVLDGDYHLEIIDILEKPQVAEQERIIATPTLVKVLPEPSHRVIGDLSVTDKVLLGLDLVVEDKSKI